MRSKRFAQRCSSEIGSVLPFVALGLTTLLLFLALALDQGVLYVGRTQLQQMVDASSRAALLALARQGATRQDAISAANEVAANNSLMQGGLANTNFNVVFGTYNFLTGAFVQEEMPIGTPQAVRIVVSRAGDRSFKSLLTGSDIVANADSIAALRCRNVVFVQDVSSSFKEDITKIQDALRTTIAILALQDSFTAVGTRVGLVAFRNIVAPAGTTRMLVAPGDVAIRNAIDALDDDNVLCKDSIERQFTAGGVLALVPSCVGSDMRGALRETERLLAPGNGRLEACEDLVLTISDGVPCKITEADLLQFPPFIRSEFKPAPPGEPQGGGSTRQETLDFVNTTMRQTRSIAVLTANSDDRADPSGPITEANLDDFLKICPEVRGETAQVDVEFANRLVSGFGQSFESNRSQAELAEQMGAALRSIPPVIVD
jgi:hypothetical protein